MDGCWVEGGMKMEVIRPAMVGWGPGEVTAEESVPPQGEFCAVLFFPLRSPPTSEKLLAGERLDQATGLHGGGGGGKRKSWRAPVVVVVGGGGWGGALSFCLPSHGCYGSLDVQSGDRSAGPVTVTAVTSLQGKLSPISGEMSSATQPPTLLLLLLLLLCAFFSTVRVRLRPHRVQV